MSPMPRADWFSKIGFQVKPWLIVFQRLPEPKATYHVPGREGSHWIASTLAEFTTGPNEIHSRPNVELFFIFRYCSHESRSGLFASCAQTRRCVPITRGRNMKNKNLFIFIGFDLPQGMFLKLHKFPSFQSIETAG
jgi:hypothetical protein